MWPFIYAFYPLWICKTAKKTQTPYFLPDVENEFQSFTTKFSNININDLYWTKILTQPSRFSQKFRKNTQICMTIFSIIRLILKLKGFIETIIHNFFFFWYHFETIPGFKKKIHVFSGFNETFMVSDRYFGPKLAKNEVSKRPLLEVCFESVIYLF